MVGRNEIGGGDKVKVSTLGCSFIKVPKKKRVRVVVLFGKEIGFQVEF